MTGRWFSPFSSTNKTDSYDITEILLKVALNIIIILTHSQINIITVFLEVHLAKVHLLPKKEKEMKIFLKVEVRINEDIFVPDHDNKNELVSFCGSSRGNLW